MKKTTKERSIAKLKPDSVLRNYWRDNDRFADLYNQVFFGGEKVLDPGMLSDKDTDESAMIKKGKHLDTISRTRDLIKQHTNGAELVLTGLEQQMHIHYAMPVRTMVYDALRYAKQCREIENRHRTNKDLNGSAEFLSGITRTDLIVPVISIVIYYGEPIWDGPVCLSEMMNIPKPFRNLYNDHHLHLLSVRDAGRYQFANQDNCDFFTLVGDFYNNAGNMNMDVFRKLHPDMEIYWETLAAVGAATGTMKLVEYALEKKGEHINMCTALENWEKQAEIKGEMKGEIRGIKNMISTLRELEINETVIIHKLKEKYQLSEKAAKNYLS